MVQCSKCYLFNKFKRDAISNVINSSLINKKHWDIIILSVNIHFYVLCGYTNYFFQGVYYDYIMKKNNWLI